MNNALRLRGLEDGERGSGTPEVEQATAAGGDGLVVVGRVAEDVAEFVVAAAEALCRGEALEAPHTSRAALHAPVVLLQPIVLECAGPVHDPSAKRRADRPHVAS